MYLIRRRRPKINKDEIVQGRGKTTPYEEPKPSQDADSKIEEHYRSRSSNIYLRVRQVTIARAFVVQSTSEQIVASGTGCSVLGAIVVRVVSSVVQRRCKSK